MKCSYLGVGFGYMDKIFDTLQAVEVYQGIKMGKPHFFPNDNKVKDSFRKLFQVGWMFTIS